MTTPKSTALDVTMCEFPSPSWWVAHVEGDETLKACGATDPGFLGRVVVGMFIQGCLLDLKRNNNP
jgi:hypothetical protein